jgi:hypothetical protein
MRALRGAFADGTRMSRLVPLAVIFVAPVVGVLVLRAPLFNNIAYRDPWFYSGYGWTLAHHVEIFGWFYYSVRFPVTLPIGWATALFGPVTGYLVLRYLILVVTGGVLYACFRRFASVAVACTAVVLLALSSFYLRMVLWDYTSFIAVPCSIVGVAVWFMASVRGRVLWLFLGAGALLGAAVFANALSATVVGSLLLVEGVSALRQGIAEVVRLAARCLAALAGGLLVFVAGWLAYCAYLGWFGLDELLSPTLEFMRQNNQLSAPFQHPLSEVLRTEPRIYGPVLLSVALVVIFGRRLLENTLPSRLAQFAVAYVGLVWLYRVSITSSVVETWWAYNMTAVSTAFGLPLLAYGVSVDQRLTRSRLLLAAAALGTAVASVIVRTENVHAAHFTDRLRHNLWLLLAGLAAGLFAAVAMRLRMPVARLAATTAFFGIFAAVSLAPAGFIGIAQTGEFSPFGRSEVLGYRAAYDMSKLLEGRDQPDSRVMMWTTLVGLPMIAWTDLPHQGGSIFSPDAPLLTLSDLPQPALDLVRYPTTRGVLVFSENPADMTTALAALERAHVVTTVRRKGTWADGHLHYELLYLSRGAR